MGCMIVGMMPFPGIRVKYCGKTTIKDDLLQIVINLRMGRDYSLKARAYSDEYIIDLDKKILYSPGPDREPFTEDDIKLEINPEVLGLTE